LRRIGINLSFYADKSTGGMTIPRNVSLTENIDTAGRFYIHKELNTIDEKQIQKYQKTPKVSNDKQQVAIQP
jgi:hypothetical protein